MRRLPPPSVLVEVEGVDGGGGGGVGALGGLADGGCKPNPLHFWLLIWVLHF